MRIVIYKFSWPVNLHCTLADVDTVPEAKVKLVNMPIIPYKEIDKIAATITEGTDEEAAEKLAKKIKTKFPSKERFWRVVVTLNEDGFFETAFSENSD